MSRRGMAGVVIAGLAAFGMAEPRPAPVAQTYPNAPILVEADWLQGRLKAPGLRLIDLRPPEAYLRGHIPVAVRLSMEETRTVRDGVRGMLKPVAELEAVFSRRGIGPDTHVVLYDDLGGLDAARVFWTLEYLGHARVSLLNGGWSKWVREGRPVTTDQPELPPAAFRARVEGSRLATAGWIRGRLNTAAMALVDARTPAEFAGEDVRAARGGHIPGAANIPWEMHLNQDRTFKPARALRSMYAMAGAREDMQVVTYCQTGHRSAHTYFVLRLLGFPHVRLYDGSWEEWGNRQELPQATGHAKPDRTPGLPPNVRSPAGPSPR